MPTSLVELSQLFFNSSKFVLSTPTFIVFCLIWLYYGQQRVSTAEEAEQEREFQQRLFDQVVHVQNFINLHICNQLLFNREFFVV